MHIDNIVLLNDWKRWAESARVHSGTYYLSDEGDVCFKGSTIFTFIGIHECGCTHSAGRTDERIASTLIIAPFRNPFDVFTAFELQYSEPEELANAWKPIWDKTLQSILQDNILRFAAGNIAWDGIVSSWSSAFFRTETSVSLCAQIQRVIFDLKKAGKLGP